MLKNLVGSKGIKATVGTIGSQVTKGVSQQVNREINNAQRQAQNTVGTAVNKTVKGVLGAAGQLMTGNTQGAIDAIGNIPNNILSGMSTGSSSLFSNIFGASGSSVTLNSAKPGDGYQGIIGRADPMMSYNWYVELPPLNVPERGLVNLSWNYVEEASLPFRQTEIQSRFREGRRKHFLKSYSVDGLRLGFYMDEANASMQYLEAWEALKMEPTTLQNYTTNGGRFRLPGSFWKPVRFFFLSADRREFLAVTYIECFPINLEAISLNSDASNRIIGQVGFSCGDVFISAFGVNSDLLNSLDAGEQLMPMLATSYNNLIGNAGRSLVNNAVRATSGAVNAALNSVFRF